MKTPISLTNDCGVMSYPHTLFVSTVGGALQHRKQLPLSWPHLALSDGPSIIHRLTSTVHRSILRIAYPLPRRVGHEGIPRTASCVSSVYKLYLTLCLANIALIGMQYVVNNRGPRTDPCGTPQHSCRWRDIASPIFIAIVLLDR